MRDQELIATVVGAAAAVMPIILDGDEPVTPSGIDPVDIEVPRILVRALVAGGTSQHALHWTAEVLELTTNVMAHHRDAIPPANRQAWNQVSLLLRTTGIAFAETVGRVPGTARDLDADILHVTYDACRSMTPYVDHAALRVIIVSCGVVLSALDRIEGKTPYGSAEVDRVLSGLRPLAEHRHGS